MMVTEDIVPGREPVDKFGRIASCDVDLTIAQARLTKTAMTQRSC
ncbi:hypothetical protein [Paracoccus sp. Ld10]